MKIGVMADSFRKPFNTAIKQAKSLGASGVQIYVASGEFDVDKMTDLKRDEMIKILDKYDMEITAFCGDTGMQGGFLNESNLAVLVPKTKRMIDFAYEMGVAFITTHIGVIPEDKTLPAYQNGLRAMGEVGLYAKDHGVILAIETGPEKAIVLKEFIEQIEGIGVNLDPANFVMVTGQDPVEAVHILKDYIVHTHAKDGIKLREHDPREVYGGLTDEEKSACPSSPAFHEVPLGEGSVDFDKYLQALKDIGFDGYLTIERESGDKPIDDIGMAVDFLSGKLGKGRQIVVGVVGCGGIAFGAHFPSIQIHSDKIKIKYCCDVFIDKANKAVSEFGINGYTKACIDYKDILNDPEVDAVIVCTHTNFHSSISLEAMRAGKHVMTEKPIAMNYSVAEEMAQVANDTGKIMNIGVCMRYDSAVNQVKRLISQGLLGEIFHVYCSFRNFRNIPGLGGEFTTKTSSGGGVLFDWGVHYLDLILYALDNPNIKTASAATFNHLGKDIKAYKFNNMWTAPNTNGVCDVEESVTGLVRTDSAVINLNGAWAQNIDIDETFIDFMGSKGGVRMTYGGDFQLFTEKNGKLVTLKPRVAKIPRIHEPEMVDFYNDIILNTKSRNHIDYVLNSAKLLDMLYHSAALSKEVSCDD